ncbi:carbohydrate ABC transporter permease [Paenibacillus piri]|uniref:Carbohydrate ABC transporter permease n=1 Tax=Paenibacillus piri TaxID=2547395 RepID=A0A4R5KEQ8_9BACL|nr:carbohydrate ABC transporter permease [Paenibacillus piri]TDF93831.1 carbohydrate ABC transporter permease [Paenibacillus piri]
MGHSIKKFFQVDLVFLILAVIYVFPLYIVVVNSFKSYQEALVNPYFLPEKWGLDNFIKVIEETYFLEALKNSLITTVIVVSFLVIFSSMTAYALIRRSSGINGFLYLFFIAGVLIPFQIYMIPLVKLLSILGILRTPLALMLTFIAQFTSLSVFLYTAFMKTIPKEIEEAAFMDGCGPYRTYFNMVFPLLKPCTASVIIFFSINVWNSFIQPMAILGTTRWKILFVEIYSFVQNDFFQQWHMTFAACFLSLLPITILYLFMQNLIIGGLAGGAVKG